MFIPAEGWTFTRIFHSWKSFTASEANKPLKRTGKFWQAEYFDRVVRNERGFNAAVEYIERNPVVAGLCGSPEEWRFGSAFHRGAQASCLRMRKAYKVSCYRWFRQRYNQAISALISLISRKRW